MIAKIMIAGLHRCGVRLPHVRYTKQEGSNIRLSIIAHWIDRIDVNTEAISRSIEMGKQ